MYKKLEEAMYLLDVSLIVPLSKKELYTRQASQCIREYIEEGYRMNPEETSIGD